MLTHKAVVLDKCMNEHAYRRHQISRDGAADDRDAVMLELHCNILIVSVRLAWQNDLLLQHCNLPRYTAL